MNIINVTQELGNIPVIYSQLTLDTNLSAKEIQLKSGHTHQPDQNKIAKQIYPEKRAVSSHIALPLYNALGNQDQEQAMKKH
jgi:hypothetical protein